MRRQEEIQRAVEHLTSRPAFLKFKGDTFRYGYLIGKVVALGWTLGEPSADISIDYTFEDWCRELREAGEGLSERLNARPDEPTDDTEGVPYE